MTPDAPVRRRPTTRLRATGAVVALVVALVTLPTAGASAATPERYHGVRSKVIAKAASGARTMYVATNGSDTYTYAVSWGTKTIQRHSCLRKNSRDEATCPAATKRRPLRTVTAAIRAARPGDVIVVRGGTYREAAGYDAAKGTATKPIELQSYPGERVELNGTLQLRNASYWTVRGIHFTYNRSIQGKGQAVVHLQGGTGWVFTNNEVTGSRETANLMVTPGARGASPATQRAAGPNRYTIAYNCIRNNAGSHAHGMDHNIYLMAGIYSSGGTIERNLLAAAPNGAHIKAAASTWDTWKDSPRHVTIRYNTMLGGAAGVTVGVAAQDVSLWRNAIANQPTTRTTYDAAVKTWELERHDLVSVKRNLVAGYAKAYHEAPGKSLVKQRNAVTGRVSYTGSVAGCTAKLAQDSLRTDYGQYAR